MNLKTRFRNSAATAAALALGGMALAGQAAAQAIQVETLEAVDPISVGVLGQREGGLPDAMWRGTTADLAEAAMALAPAESESPAVNNLLRHILLSGGAAPEGGRGDELAAARLDALIRAGMAAQAATLAARTPGVGDRPALSEGQARAALMSGQLDAACRAADDLRQGRDAVFWLRLRATCLAADGETARADLTAQLARQDGRNEQFERAYSLAILGEAPDEEVQTADPLVFAAAVRAGALITLPATAPRSMQITPLPGSEAEVRAMDITRAALMGLADPRAVVAAYETVEPPLSEDAPAVPGALGIEALDAALEAEGALRLAYLYQLSVDPASPDEIRAQALAAALDSADSPAAFMLAARVMAQPLRTLDPEAGRDDALLFARAGAAAAEPSIATRWRDVATTRPAPPAPEIDPTTGAPVPLGLRPRWDPPEEADLEDLDALIALYEDAPGAAALRLDQAAAGVEEMDLVHFVDAVVLDALGKEGGSTLRLAILQGAGREGERVDPDILLAMEGAAHANAMAETGLLAAAALAPGPAVLAPADLARVLRAMVAAGLEADAREAGLEAMLAARR